MDGRGFVDVRAVGRGRDQTRERGVGRRQHRRGVGGAVASVDPGIFLR